MRYSGRVRYWSKINKGEEDVQMIGTMLDETMR